MMLPPDLHDLPVAVVSAERLHGSLTPCGPGYRSVGWPDSPAVRAMTLRPYLPLRPPCAIVLLTAAWVWGADWEDDDVCEISSLQRVRLLHAPAPGVRVHEFRIEAEHTVHVAGVRVTTRHRTLFDLLFLPPEQWTPRVQRACAHLVQVGRVESMSFADTFLERRRPHIRRAARRLDTVLTMQ